MATPDLRRAAELLDEAVAGAAAVLFEDDLDALAAGTAGIARIYDRAARVQQKRRRKR